MLNLDLLTNTVQKNCHISDARHAGDYTLCIYLLKMREFYRWEHGIPLRNNLPAEAIGAWMQAREQTWQQLEAEAFTPLPLASGALEPFDTDGVNRELIPQGYIYSGGYGRLNKPHFFLGRLQSQETRAGYTIYVSAREYARDLEAPPAMLQERDIYIRRESVRRYLWEKIEEWRWNRKDETMARALAGYSFAQDAEAALDRMTENESETMILHELGEARAGEQLGDSWHDMLSGLSRSKAEIMARAVRDIVADNLVTLPALIERENTAALHFYFASFTGMRRQLYPEIMTAYRRWADGGNISGLRGMVEQGEYYWLGKARSMLALPQGESGDVNAAFENLLLPATAA
jgi:hypothetical protein